MKYAKFAIKPIIVTMIPIFPHRFSDAEVSEPEPFTAPPKNKVATK
jgi:hypothetical protein